MVCLFKNVSETSDVSAEKSSRNHIKTSLPAIEIPCKYGIFFLYIDGENARTTLDIRSMEHDNTGSRATEPGKGAGRASPDHVYTCR